jgi:signal transduction histidine kinase
MNARWRHSRRRPPWWPANEPWPTPRMHAWRRHRSRVVRRFGILFAVVLVLSAIGASTLVSLVTGRAGLSAASPSPAVVIMPALAFVLVLAGFVVALRRIGFPLGDIVMAADRVAGGDYSTRIREHGPRSLRLVAQAFNSMTTTLQSQDEQRRNLMADIAHELRTPLAVIQGRLEGLLDGVYPRDDVVLAGVLDDTRILARLVEDLRTLSNAEAGRLVLNKEPTDLAVLIQDVVKSFSAQAETNHITVRVVAADLPIIEVDPLRLWEVLSNLLSNAIRHTGRGGSVSVTAESDAEGIVVKVSDTGAGISAEELPRIFDRFYKGGASKGSGLGLTIARNLITAHGGDIRAESRLGEGTTITFRLPIGVDLS